jgi:hypothetical protein
VITIIIITSIMVTVGLGLPDNTPEPYEKSLKNWKMAIIDYVEDEEREKKALEIIANFAQTLKQTQEENNASFEHFFAIDRRYDATMKDYEVAITSLGAIWSKNDEKMIDGRFELQNTLTEEEWLLCLDDVKEAMSKFREKTVKKVEKDKKKRTEQVEKIEKSKKDAF